jgi:hypothetical protein
MAGAPRQPFVRPEPASPSTDEIEQAFWRARQDGVHRGRQRVHRRRLGKGGVSPGRHLDQRGVVLFGVAGREMLVSLAARYAQGITAAHRAGQRSRAWQTGRPRRCHRHWQGRKPGGIGPTGPAPVDRWRSASRGWPTMPGCEPTRSWAIVPRPWQSWSADSRRADHGERLGRSAELRGFDTMT